jgi:hypothetical protein
MPDEKKLTPPEAGPAAGPAAAPAEEEPMPTKEGDAGHPPLSNTSLGGII